MVALRKEEAFPMCIGEKPLNMILLQAKALRLAD
jgi:hypothetical protein